MLRFWPSSPVAPSRAPHLVVSLVLVGSILTPSGGSACVGPPAEPFCTKTLQLAIAGPPTILLPAGGTFDVEALVYFRLLDFPAGTGICPAGPYLVDVDIMATCTPSGADGSGQRLGAVISNGYNTLTIPVTVPAGPARRCTLSATATLALSDGMVLGETADNVACLADPVPGMPSTPRLDLRLVGLPGDEIARTHPGDPAGFLYEIVNNDPSETFTGTLTVDSLNESRMPSVSGPMPTGTAVVSISDPVEGDNFPFDVLLGQPAETKGQPVEEGCVTLPPDPTDPMVPIQLVELSLDPGATLPIVVNSRHWGMCADGSCGRSTLVIEGAFSDTTTGSACTGFVLAADTSVPPDYTCDDSGDTAKFPPPTDPSKLITVGSPRPGLDLGIEAEVSQATLHENGVPADPPIPFSGILTSEQGQIQLQFAETFAVDSFFDLAIQVRFTGVGEPPNDVVTELRSVGAPTGYESMAPVAMLVQRIENAVGGNLLGFGTSTLQLDAVAIDNLGNRRRLSFGAIDFTVLPGGTGISGSLGGGTVEDGAGSGLDAIELVMRWRSFISPEPQDVLIFEDGFESGNVSRWSASNP